MVVVFVDGLVFRDHYSMVPLGEIYLIQRQEQRCLLKYLPELLVEALFSDVRVRALV